MLSIPPIKIYTNGWPTIGDWVVIKTADKVTYSNGKSFSNIVTSAISVNDVVSGIYIKALNNQTNSLIIEISHNTGFIIETPDFTNKLKCIARVIEISGILS